MTDVESAAVRIVAQGSFVDPAVGEYEGAGSGSGFIIDPVGHRRHQQPRGDRAGPAAGLRGGGEDEPRNAKVLGVCECSDLAVIDLEGDGYPYLEWAEGDPRPGLEIYAAGFPLGDPEFTLTKGIVAKAEADGETNWASVDHVVEHDANIQPGNSGGPLVTGEGQVVGVNYAGGGPPTPTSSSPSPPTRPSRSSSSCATARTSSRSA